MGQSGVANAERPVSEPVKTGGAAEGAGPRAGVCDRRVDEEQRWQFVFEITVNSTANNFNTVQSTSSHIVITKWRPSVCVSAFEG